MGRLGLSIALLALFACEEPPPRPTVPNNGRGLWVLNEGEGPAYPATISLIAPDGTTTQGVYEAINGEILGHYGNRWVRVEDTLWLPIDEARTIYKLQLPTGERLGKLHFTANTFNPRQVAWVRPDLAYATAFKQKEVVAFNPATLVEIARTPIGARTDAALALGEHVAVGAINLNGEQDNRVFLLNTTHQVAHTLRLPRNNIGELALQPNGRLRVLCLGNNLAGTQTGGFYWLDTTTWGVLDSLPLAGNALHSTAQLGDWLYYFYYDFEDYDDQSIGRYNLVTHVHEAPFRTRQQLGLESPGLVPRGLGRDPATGRLLVFVGNYTLNGFVLELDEDFRPLKRYDAGVFPTQGLRWP